MENLGEQDMDQLLAYWNQTLPEAEAEQIRRRLESDAVFSEEAARFKVTYSTLLKARRRKWDERLRKTESALPIALQTQSNHSFWYRWAGVLIALSILAIGVWVWKKDRPVREGATKPLVAMAHKAFKAPDITGIPMSAAADDLKTRAAIAYRSGDFAAAAAAWEAYMRLEPGATPTDRFYMGVSQLGADRFDEALNVFRALSGQDGLDENQLRWYEALSLTALGRTQEAKEILAALANGGDYASDARALLEQLRQQGF